MQTRYTYIAVVLVAAIISIAVFMVSNSSILAQSVDQSMQQGVQNTSTASNGFIRGASVSLGQVAGGSTTFAIKPEPKLSMPISQGLTRVTKKSFGLFVTPQNSPVANDIFNGYHTGIDFEANTSEQNTDVTITAACDGKVLLKQWATGYGGVLVQACKIDGEDATVIYGHLNLDSIRPAVGQAMLAGDKIGSLGQGFSHETDGRRKHLHFDIHKGTEINILGYIDKQGDLANWLDPMKYLE